VVNVGNNANISKLIVHENFRFLRPYKGARNYRNLAEKQGFCSVNLSGKEREGRNGEKPPKYRPISGFSLVSNA
jgi:hypothetical protein